MELNKKTTARPFLKWAGGKTQLLPAIDNALPKEIRNESFIYIEPFIGSGAVLFWMLSNFPKLERAIINDVNVDLINTYEVIANSPKALIKILEEWQTEYHSFESNPEGKAEYYYNKRNAFNSRVKSKSEHAALFIFLNRTCFNGLFRVNRNNHFNVPIGSYKAPMICDKENILAVSKALQKVEILSGDFEDTLSKAEGNTFFYLDPPYKPLSQTSSFTAYSKDEFDDTAQIRLRDFCKNIDAIGHKWMLSNSDVRGKDNDPFFDEIYDNYNISRIKAKRMINANPSKRGELNELLIVNFRGKKQISFN